MDHAAYHVIYVDTRASRDLDGIPIHNFNDGPSTAIDARQGQPLEDYDPECLRILLGEIEAVRTNLKRLLAHFNRVHVCRSRKTCMANLRRLDSSSSEERPILVFAAVAHKAASELPTSDHLHTSGILPSPVDPAGLPLLQHISNETAKSNLSKLVIPIAVLFNEHSGPSHPQAAAKPSPSVPLPGDPLNTTLKGSNIGEASGIREGLHPQISLRCIDVGAHDVLESPLQDERLQSIIVRAYRSHKEAIKDREDSQARKRSRKLSWLGNTEDKPYAYLREKMVSELMTGICNPDEHLHLGDKMLPPDLAIEREAYLKHALGSWAYSGHAFTEDELVHAAIFMLQHALALPELERWRQTPAKLRTFLMASRAAYNEFVDYHNFRHVIDVMQAVFYFLIQLRVLPPYPNDPSQESRRDQRAPLATLLQPLDALTLLITAIGHDVGHPGVNNAFLVALNAPLAQLYNDRSVLEAFHCAAYSQILRRYWKTAFEDNEMRSLMINSILATDMGVHQRYMSDLGNLQEKLHHQQGIDGFNAQQLDEYRVLTCALLIKCADISNVARPYEIAVKWANILQLEFANQGTMEQEVGIPTTLFGGPPELGNITKLGQSQNSFMNFFARPLFEAVTDVLPAMGFAVDEMKTNQARWTERMKAEGSKQKQGLTPRQQSSSDLSPHLSPRSRSPADRPSSQPELSHPEGLPASSHSAEHLLNMPQSQPILPSQGGRLSEPAVTTHPPILSDRSLQSTGSSRRSSHNTPLPQQLVGSAPSTDFSRRSSGAFSSANNPHVVIAPRRTSNTSPSQLHLAPDPMSSTHVPPASENKLPNGRASEDTLSQMQAVHGVQPLTPDVDHNLTHSAGAGAGTGVGAGDGGRRGSKVRDQVRATAANPYQNFNRPYAQGGHHRSSSGAHTNNTSASHATPYSPTGTQATSVLTVDSDEKSSQSRANSWVERNGAPGTVDVEQAGSQSSFGALSDSRGAAKDLDVKTSILSNGSSKMSDLEHRSVGKKSSKFNIFHSWKRRGNRGDFHL